MRKLCMSFMVVIAFCVATLDPAFADDEHLVPILGITMEKRPIGMVAYIAITFTKRKDANGLIVQFKNKPGAFSRLAQTSIDQAIRRAANIEGISTDSWTVVFKVPYDGLTVYGESLSAMMALSVIALANETEIPIDRVITGTITPDGHIGPVGSVSEKLAAASLKNIHRVVIPDAESEGPTASTPFMLHVSPVSTVHQAYIALTEGGR